MRLLFHPSTDLLLKGLQRDLPQSLLLSGKKGIGLLTVANTLVKNIPPILLQPKNAKGDVDDVTGTIGVEAIRELYSQTRTKSRTKRIIILDNAERMSRGAQAAFLKLLEEPNIATYFILTSHLPDALLPTIHSRVQRFSVQLITTEQSKQLITTLDIHDAAKQTQLLFLANGLPAELTRLATDEAYFSQHAAVISDARTFITSDAYQKIRILQKYRSSRDDTLRLVDSAITILRFTLNSKPQHKLIEQLDQLLEARERIAANQNTALQLARAVL